MSNPKTTSNPLVFLDSNKRIELEAIHRQSNLLLIPIYTDWANRYLSKSKLEPIRELTADLKDPKILVGLLNAVTSDCIGSAPDNLLCSLNSASSLECVDKSLEYLARLGVNVAGIQSRDILCGELGTVLSLLYALSHFKQQQKALQLDRTIQKNPTWTSFQSKMPPNTSGIVQPTRVASAIRVPQIAPVATCSSPASSTVKSKLAAPPTRISTIPNPTLKGVVTKTALPTPSPIAAKLSSGTRIKPPTKQPSINETSAHSVASSSTNTYASIQSTSSGTSLKAPTKTLKTPSKAVAIPSVPSTSEATSALKPPSGGKMLKLFSAKDKLKKPEIGLQKPQISAPIALQKSPDEKTKIAGPSPSSIKSQLKVPKKSLLQPPSSLPSNIVPSRTNVKDERQSNSSEDDSAYAGSGPSNFQTSILVSPSKPKEMTTPTTSTHSTSDFDDSGIHSDNSAVQSNSANPMDQKPTLAVKGMASKTGLKLPTTSTTTATVVGVVSPITQPSKSDFDSKPKPDVPTRVDSKLSETKNALSESLIEDVVVPMKPIKIHPEIRHSKGPLAEPLSTVPEILDDSLASIQTAICLDTKKRRSENFSEGESLACPDTPTKGNSSGYQSTAEAAPGVAVYARRMRTNFEAAHGMRKPKPVDFGDSFEDSSSISSGISENFDDVSTDDLTGSSLCDYPMATTATRSDYHPLNFRQNASKLPNPLPSSQRQSRNGNNFATVQNSSRVYSSLVPKVALSEDGTTLSISRNVAGRSSLRYQPTQTKNSNGFAQQMPIVTSHSAQNSPYHSQSLDRHGHLKIFADSSAPNSPYRLALAPQNTTASPRNSGMSSEGYHSGRQSVAAKESRSSQRRSSSLSLSANGSMSRSMVLFETADGAVLPLSGTALSIIENGSQNQPPSGSASVILNGKHSPRLRRAQMAAVEINFGGSVPSSPARTQSVNQGSFSARSESSDVYATYHGLQLHKLSGVQSPLSKTTNRGGPILQNGSELSLASIGGHEAYEAEIQKLNYELENYRSTVNKLTTKHENYHQMIQMFDTRLQMLVRHINKLNQKSQLKEEEVEKLKSQIEYLRSLSSCSTGNGKMIIESAGELMRHPSLESVASHRSSMSSSSKSSKIDKNGFKNSKKSWTANMDNQIRSSFSKAFHKKKSKNGSCSDVEQSPLHSLKPIAGSTNQLDEYGTAVPEVAHLKRELKNKDEILTDIRLDALDKAREVDILRETVARLANENKLLKRNCTLLAKRIDSRTSSRQSLSTCQDEDPTYDPLPTTTGGSSSSHMSERSFSSTSSSKRSSGGLNTRVCISLEPSGSLDFTPHQHELTIGCLPPPTAQTTWMDIDLQLTAMLREYLHRIECDSTMGIDVDKSIIGYKIGAELVRNRSTPDMLSQTPFQVISPTTTVRIRLQGVNQKAVDGLIVESLFPKAILDQMIRLLEQSRRLVIHGARGIGKSNLARTLAKYFSIRLASNGKPESIVDVRYPDDEKDAKFAQVQQNLQTLLKAGTSPILLIDNVQRKCIPHLMAAFKLTDPSSNSGPFVICTVNGALQRQVEEMQSFHGFRIFQLTNHMDAVRGFMGRYLRRRIAEAELTGQCRCSEQLQVIIDFLGRTLLAINTFIEKANAHDETIGPRTFVQCPLSIEASKDWFIRLWNENLVPYMIRAAKEGMILGCRGQLKDPTEFVIEHWPWPDSRDAKLLQKVVVDKNKIVGEFDPMLALERIEESRKQQLHIA